MAAPDTVVDKTELSNTFKRLRGKSANQVCDLGPYPCLDPDTSLFCFLAVICDEWRWAFISARCCEFDSFRFFVG